jgi:hypothetical protein
MLGLCLTDLADYIINIFDRHLSGNLALMARLYTMLALFPAMVLARGAGNSSLVFSSTGTSSTFLFELL